MSGWVYIVANKPNGTIYIGVTSNLPRRAWEHREGVVEGFTKTYGLKRLVFAEEHTTMLGAIQREHTMKHWNRAWKLALVTRLNPRWDDLFEHLN